MCWARKIPRSWPLCWQINYSQRLYLTDWFSWVSWWTPRASLMGGASRKVSADRITYTFVLLSPPPPVARTTPKYLSVAGGEAFQHSQRLYIDSLAWMAGTDCPDLRSDLKHISTSIKSLYVCMGGKKGLLKVSSNRVDSSRTLCLFYPCLLPFFFVACAGFREWMKYSSHLDSLYRI